MKLYLVMWRSSLQSQWTCGPDDIYTDLAMAKMQQCLDQHKHPHWEVIVAETDVPGVATAQPEPEAA